MAWLLTWLHLTWPDFIWLDLTSSDLTWLHLTWPDFIWLDLTSFGLTWLNSSDPSTGTNMELLRQLKQADMVSPVLNADTSGLYWSFDILSACIATDVLSYTPFKLIYSLSDSPLFYDPLLTVGDMRPSTVTLRTVHRTGYTQALDWWQKENSPLIRW